MKHGGGFREVVKNSILLPAPGVCKRNTLKGISCDVSCLDHG